VSCLRTHCRAVAADGFVLALVLAVPAASCRRADGESAAPSARVVGSRLELPANSPHLAALTTTPAVSDSASAVSLDGRLTWDEDLTVRVFSPFAGRVTRVLADQGQRVGRGEALALIAAPDFGQAQADVKRASADLDLAQRTLTRQRDLLEHGVVAQKDVEAAEADVTRARAEHERAVARLSSYSSETTTVDQMFSLPAPLGGEVVERNITPGQEVRPDQMLANAPQLFAPLFVITDPAQLWVMLDVPEQNLSLVRQGAPIALHAQGWPNRVFRGRVTLVAGALDPNTRTLKVRGAVDNADGALKGEMLVTVDLMRPAAARAAVPEAAVLLNGDTHFVFVEQARGHYERRAVEVGAAHDGVVPVLSGLNPGERVVVGSALLLEQLFQTTAHS
jgi:membrane fusion protein, heavy metal efflux system